MSCPSKNWGSFIFPSPGKTCQYVGLAGGSAVSYSTFSFSCCFSFSPLPPSLSTPWTSSTSQGPWRAWGLVLEQFKIISVLHFGPLWFSEITILLSNAEPSYYPVLSNTVAVGVFSALALHRLLFRLLRVPLDQVVTSCQPQFSSVSSNGNSGSPLLQIHP